MNKNTIPTYSAKDFEKMHKAGALAAKILDNLSDFICPNITTQMIHQFLNRADYLQLLVHGLPRYCHSHR